MNVPKFLEPEKWSFRLLWRIAVQQPKPHAAFSLGLLTLGWGVWCLMPWDVYVASSIYGWMGTLIPEEWAGLTCIALSLPLLISPAGPYYSRLAGWCVLLASAQSALWWGTVTGSCLEGEWRTTATPVYGLFGVLALWLFWSSLWVLYSASPSQPLPRPPQQGAQG